MGTIYREIHPLAFDPSTSSVATISSVAGTNFPVTVASFAANSVNVAYYRLGAELYGTGNWTVEIHWYSISGSTSGNVTWSVQIAAITPNVDTGSVEAKAFATATTATLAANANAKADYATSMSISNLDSVASGDDVWLRVTRSDNASSMTGNAGMLRMIVSYPDSGSTAAYSTRAALVSSVTVPGTSTLTSTSGLSLTTPSAGTYQVGAYLDVDCTTTANLAFSVLATGGTISSFSAGQSLSTSGTTSAYGSTGTNGGAIATAATRSSTARLPVFISASFVSSSAGTVNIQGSASATTTTINAGSYATLVKVS